MSGEFDRLSGQVSRTWRIVDHPDNMPLYFPDIPDKTRRTLGFWTDHVERLPFFADMFAAECMEEAVGWHQTCFNIGGHHVED